MRSQLAQAEDVMSDLLKHAEAIDWRKAFSTEPEPHDYVLPGLTSGGLGSLISPGGQGKSILALMLAHLVGGGVDLLGLGTFPTGHVVYLSAEERKNILHQRLYYIGRKLDAGQREKCAEGIALKNLMMCRPDLINGKDAVDWWEAIEAEAAGARLLVLDTLCNFHSGDQNNSGDMALLTNRLRAIAARTQCAIIFLHNSAQLSKQGCIQQVASGSSVLTDGIGWQAYLGEMTNEESRALVEEGGQPIGDSRYYVRFGIAKQIYGALFAERWFKRAEAGILEPVTLKPVVRKTHIREGYNRIVREHKSRRGN